ncbi:hypothetical protein OZK63_03490 [Streptomyces sp. UMAF16]|nr:hypothetical protein [Streptomyces sp. UMAF16]
MPTGYRRASEAQRQVAPPFRVDPALTPAAQRRTVVMRELSPARALSPMSMRRP